MKEINKGGYDNLTHKNITNCIKEIPQRIKLELSNGTLTLKKGSIVTVPNGFESDGTTPKFDYVTTTSDLTYGFLDTQSGEYILECNYAGTSVGWSQLKNAGSGTSTEATTGHYYRTDLNKIYYQNNTSSAYNAFPLGIVILEAGVPTLKQVFNGIGFIGSTIWVDKGVKYLIPNGRNEDGTLNNIEINTTKLTTTTNPFGATPIPNSCMALTTSGSVGVMYRYIESNVEPTTPYTSWYNPTTNKMLYRGGSGSEWGKQEAIPIASLDWTYVASPKTNTFTSLVPKQPFRAADDQEVVKKSGDTINGSLFIESSNNNYGYIVKNTDYAYDELPSENHSIGTYNIVDKNDTWTTLFGFEKYTDGRNLAKVQVRGVDGTQARMQVWVDKSGNSFCSFPICTTKATTTSSASSSKIAVVTQNYVSGNSWYRVWSDGWVEQGGRVTVEQRSSTAITFLKPFSNTYYTAQLTSVTGTNQSAGASQNGALKDLTTTGMTAVVAEGAKTFSWYACGY